MDIIFVRYRNRQHAPTVAGSYRTGPLFQEWAVSSLSWLRETGSQRGLDQFDRLLRIVHFHNQFVVALVMQVNDDGLLRVVHIPEDSFAVLIEGSRRDHSRQIGSGHFDSVKPAACPFRVDSNSGKVHERDFES